MSALAPGVYIKEVQQSALTIGGVSTSTTAFVGYYLKTPPPPPGTQPGAPVKVTNFGEFKDLFGFGSFPSAYAVMQFFANGGSEAWIVPVGPFPNPISSVGPLTPAVQVRAANESVPRQAWITWMIEEGAGKDDFSLTMSLFVPGSRQAEVTRRFTDLSARAGSPRYAPKVLAANRSTLLHFTEDGEAALEDLASLTSGLTGAKFDPEKMAGVVRNPIRLSLAQGERSSDRYDIALDESNVISPFHAATALQRNLRSIPSLRNARVRVLSDQRLHVSIPPALDISDVAQASRRLVFEGPAAEALGLVGEGVESRAQQNVVEVDVQPPTVVPTDVIAALDRLAEVDIYNLLSIPDCRRCTLDQAATIITAADARITGSNSEFAFLIVDPPAIAEDVAGIKDFQSLLPASDHAALYYPTFRIPDPNNDSRPIPVGPSGTLAGLYARNDANRGVWKAPAGVDALLGGVVDLTQTVTDATNGDLNPRGVNCLRQYSGIGIVAWGARTLRGADFLSSEWKYIPVRRLALYIEDSLKRGLVSTVFYPNGPTLWATITTAVSSFMNNLFRQGAFAGDTTKDAYFVVCDSTTTSQDDILKGIVNVKVGFAPILPAEFVVITLQQLAAQP